MAVTMVIVGDRCVTGSVFTYSRVFPPVHQEGCGRAARKWGQPIIQEKKNQPYSRKPCAVDSVVIINPTNMGIISKGSQRYFCSASIPLLIPLTRFTIDDSSSRKRFTRFNRTLDGSSLEGGSGSGRADGTVHQVLRCQSKAQMIDNAFVQQVKTIAITADELWSFIQTTKHCLPGELEVGDCWIGAVRPQTVD